MTRLVLAAIVALLVLPAAAAADVTVTTIVDGDDGECVIDCTLREALDTAPAGETVLLHAGTYTVTQQLKVAADVTVRGDGARVTTILFENVADPERVMLVEPNIELDLSHVTVSGGTMPDGEGGGINVSGGATLHLSDSAIAGNTAGEGGGIWSTGTLDIERSTISGNFARDDDGLSGHGGGVFIDVGDPNATSENVTLSGNSADGHGGAVYTQSNLDLTNVTIADNFAGLGQFGDGGGIYQRFLDSATLRTLAVSTLVARNTGGNCAGTAINSDNSIAHPIQATYSLSDEASSPSCNVVPDASNQLVDDTRLDFLADNGGETKTHALLFDSPGIETGATPCVATDQRGIARPKGSDCDIGAFEADPPATLTVKTVVDSGDWHADDFTIRVTQNGFDVVPPRPGIGTPEGDTFLVPAGTYQLGAEGARGYTATPEAACDGDLVLPPDEITTCTITFAFTAPPDNGFVVESYSPSRTDGAWGLNEPFLAQTRSYVQDATAFGPSGVVHRSFDVAPGIRQANERTLAGVDVLFTGWVPSGSYTPAEKAALRDFVRDGGTLIATTDDTGHSMVDAFGLTQADGAGDPTENVIIDLDHAIANGAFGAVSRYRQYAATGNYSALGPDAHAIGRYASGPGTTLAVIEPGRLAPGSGAAIFVADVDVFTDHGGAVFNRSLIKNIFAFAAGEGARPSISIGEARATEADTTFTFPVRLSKGSDSPVRVHFGTANDTAVAGSDYTATSGDLVFEAGQTVKNVAVQVRADSAAEADERFRVNLSNATGARIADAQGIGTIVNDDAQASQQLPPPEAGESVNVVPDGTVKIKVPGSDEFITLTEGQQIPVGTVVDVRKGRVSLTAAGGGNAFFYAGIFKIAQGKGAEPLTTLSLVEKLSCPKSKASTAAKKKRKRRLWGDGKGRFRTKGRNSAATVLGTKWLVEDRCNSTLTRVARGRVSVRDFAEKKTVIVKAGKKYVARRRK